MGVGVRVRIRRSLVHGPRVPLCFARQSTCISDLHPALFCARVHRRHA